MNTQKKRGGKREGAGRKPKPDKRISTSISLEPDLYEWVKAQPSSMSNFINESLKIIKNAK